MALVLQHPGPSPLSGTAAGPDPVLAAPGRGLLAAVADSDGAGIGEKCRELERGQSESVASPSPRPVSAESCAPVIPRTQQSEAAKGASLLTCAPLTAGAPPPVVTIAQRLTSKAVSCTSPLPAHRQCTASLIRRALAARLSVAVCCGRPPVWDYQSCVKAQATAKTAAPTRSLIARVPRNFKPGRPWRTLAVTPP
jgi:hypothetical protein